MMMNQFTLFTIFVIMSFLILTTEGTCVADCQSSTDGHTGCIDFTGGNFVCTKCSKGHKLKYNPTNTGTCTQCAAGTGDDGFYKDDGPSCTACADGTGATIGSICSRCTVANCYKCTNNPATCTACVGGYGFSAGSCTICDVGQYSDAGAGPTPPGVTGLCTNCPAGKFRALTGGTGEGDCSNCPDGFGSTPGASVCYKCTVSGCQQCNTTADVCTKCLDGFYGTTTCSKCVDNCQQCPDATNCDEALYGFRIETKSPLKIVACQTFGCGVCVIDSSNVEYCKTCMPGYTSKNGQAVTIDAVSVTPVTCTACPLYYGKPIPPANGKGGGGAKSPSSPVPTNCQKCQVDQETNCTKCSLSGLNTCDECAQNLQLKDNKCNQVENPSVTCKTYKGPTDQDCLSCSMTRTLINNSCVCNPYYYQATPVQAECLACDPSCMKCSDKECTQCPDGQYIAGKKCATSGTLIDGFFEINRVFYACHTSCLTCKGALETDCLTCSNVSLPSTVQSSSTEAKSYLKVGFLLDGKCYSQCPDKYTISVTKTDCDPAIVISGNFTAAAQNLNKTQAGVTNSSINVFSLIFLLNLIGFTFFVL